MFSPGELALALALLLVIEGALYTVFPRGMQRALGMMANSEPELLQKVGLVAVIVGVGLAWFIGG